MATMAETFSGTSVSAFVCSAFKDDNTHSSFICLCVYVCVRALSLYLQTSMPPLLVRLVLTCSSLSPLYVIVSRSTANVRR